MESRFVHLRVHSEYSLVDGIVKIKPLIKNLPKLGMPAVAMTDHVNLFGLVKFYKAALAGGIKPIAGADVLILNPENETTPFYLTLLVKNNTGYVALTELISRAYQEGQTKDGVPLLKREWIAENCHGLIALSGAMMGDIGQALLSGNLQQAKHYAQYWHSLFPNSFYLELQRIGKINEAHYIQMAVELAIEMNLPVVATNDVRFVSADDFQAHEVRVCINQGVVLDDTRRPKNYTPQQYFRSSDEMEKLFADIPEALENTIEIAKRCNLTLTLGKNFLPNFPVPNPSQSIDAYFSQQAKLGLEERLKFAQHLMAQGFLPDETRKIYENRLEFELKTILQMGFAGYFLIVADFIQWAKNNYIPVGPGRGSGAGSLVAYSLKITDLDPLEFDLLFERFLNPDRVSMPDFDIDFCMDRRDEVIDYVARRYGRDHVSQIITYGSMAAKAVVRDVGRVLGFNYGFVDSLAKLIPTEVGISLQKAIDGSMELQKSYSEKEEVKTLIDMALKLENTARNAGKHAGGVVISPTKLTDFVPLYCDVAGENLVTQFDKDDVEAVGLVKFDFLGLRTLTIIDWALRTINPRLKAKGQAEIDINAIPKDDLASYQLLQKAQTTAVFQLESGGMKKLIEKLKPDCFDDIIALVALYRPGPLESGMVDDYINVKHGAPPEYAHPILAPILKPTNGVILYQEQVMQIARELSGYSLGGADLLRRAMGKKKPEEMAKQRATFVDGAVANQVDESIASHIFDLIDKFAGYGFNKSHSAAYALVAYQTAWLKAHYGAAFMAAVLSADMDNTDKVVIALEECMQMNIAIIPPRLNMSNYKFTVNEKDEIVYGLGAIKGVGEGAIEEMLIERKKNGRFTGLYDLCKRVDLRKFNKRVLEALIRAGALDEFDENRAAHLAELPTALKVAEHHNKMLETGQNDLFGLSTQTINQDTSENQSYATDIANWSLKQKLLEEKSVLGLFLTGHPIQQYQEELKKIASKKIATLLQEHKNATHRVPVKVAGLAIDLGIRQNKNGKNRGFILLDDGSERLEISVYNDVFEMYQNVFSNDNKDELFIVQGTLNLDSYTPQLSANTLQTIAQMRKTVNLMWLSVEQTSQQKQEYIARLREVLECAKGGETVVNVFYQTATEKVVLRLGDNWKIKATDDTLQKLTNLLGKNAVNLSY